MELPLPEKISRFFHPDKSPSPENEDWKRLKEILIKNNDVFSRFTRLSDELEKSGSRSVEIWETTPEIGSDKYALYFLFDCRMVPRKHGQGDKFAKGIVVKATLESQELSVMRTSDESVWRGIDRDIPDQIAFMRPEDALGFKINAAAKTAVPMVAGYMENSVNYRKIYSSSGPKAA